MKIRGMLLQKNVRYLLTSNSESTVLTVTIILSNLSRANLSQKCFRKWTQVFYSCLIILVPIFYGNRNSWDRNLVMLDSFTCMLVSSNENLRSNKIKNYTEFRSLACFIRCSTCAIAGCGLIKAKVSFTKVGTNSENIEANSKSSVLA